MNKHISENKSSSYHYQSKVETLGNITKNILQISCDGEFWCAGVESQSEPEMPNAANRRASVERSKHPNKRINGLLVFHSDEEKCFSFLVDVFGFVSNIFANTAISFFINRTVISDDCVHTCSKRVLNRCRE